MITKEQYADLVVTPISRLRRQYFTAKIYFQEVSSENEVIGAVRLDGCIYLRGKDLNIRLDHDFFCKRQPSVGVMGSKTILEQFVIVQNVSELLNTIKLDKIEEIKDRLDKVRYRYNT